ncbi:pheromone A receptor-domain-containing protein [Mycena latifolia]|nr:pheromone A receptor-domain-containing protein [Mycena latifolia]
MGHRLASPVVSLCINRRLYHHRDRLSLLKCCPHRLLICGLLPALYIAAQYIVQWHRFNVLEFEDIGCYKILHISLLTYFIWSMWPVLIDIMSGAYCALSRRGFVLRRAAFASLLSAHPALIPSRSCTPPWRPFSPSRPSPRSPSRSTLPPPRSPVTALSPTRISRIAACELGAVGGPGVRVAFLCVFWVYGGGKAELSSCGRCCGAGLLESRWSYRRQAPADGTLRPSCLYVLLLFLRH